MIAFLYYPFFLLAFWYKDVTGGVINFFAGFNRYVASLLSVPLLFKTFFKPLKNEYRDGLVLFSILAGILIKSVLLFVSVTIIFLILCTELLLVAALLLAPIGLPILIVRSGGLL